MKNQYLDEFMAVLENTTAVRRKVISEILSPLFMGGLEDLDEDERAKVEPLQKEMLERAVEISDKATLRVSREVYDALYTEEELRTMLEIRKQHPWIAEKSVLSEAEIRKLADVAAAAEFAVLKAEYVTRLDAIDL